MQYFDDDKANRTKVAKSVETQTFPVSCGPCVGESVLEPEDRVRPGWAVLPDAIPWHEGMKAARARGNSMEPRILDGQWLLFYPYRAGFIENRIVVVEDLSDSSESRYSLKKIRTVKRYAPDGTWEHDTILLFSLNRTHAPIRLDPNGCYRILGWFVAAVPKLSRPDPLNLPVLDADPC
jgi:hypothetical protein